MNARILVSVVSAALLTVSAQAATVSGSVWENATSYPNTLPTTTPGTAATATFTVTSTTATPFNFASGSSNDLTVDPTYSLGGFLGSGGDTVTFTSGGAAAGDSINNDLFQFTGSTMLTAGTVYTINHDDGMYLFLTGNGLNNAEVINSGAPTPSIPSTFTVATTGVYSFNLLYGEVNGAPADLTSPNFDVIAATPEPSSILMLGSGLVAGAGMIRRRLRA